MNDHYYLQCLESHLIPLPRPSRVGTDGNLQQIATDNRRAIFSCPYCGLVSAYFGREIRHVEAQTVDPFLTGDCRLVRVHAVCDGIDCKAPKAIHTVQDAGSGRWFGRVAPKDWRMSDSARCDSGHTLRVVFPIVEVPTENPF